MENLPKKGPLFREFGAQKPTHMGGTYTGMYPQHVMYPPGPDLNWPCNISKDSVPLELPRTGLLYWERCPTFVRKHFAEPLSQNWLLFVGKFPL